MDNFLLLLHDLENLIVVFDTDEMKIEFIFEIAEIREMNRAELEKTRVPTVFFV
jgi:hypothetical protein